MDDEVFYVCKFDEELGRLQWHWYIKVGPFESKEAAQENAKYELSNTDNRLI